jgi:hypothetical protein
MIHAHPLSDLFTSVLRACDSAINQLSGFLLATTLTATLMLPASAQTNSFQEAATQTPSFQGLGQMPGAMRGAGTFAANISNDGSTIVGYAWVCPNGGTTTGADTRLVFFNNLVVNGYAAQTRTPGFSSGQTNLGAGFDYQTNWLEVFAQHRKVGPNFNPEVGFLGRTDCMCDYVDVNFKPAPENSRCARPQL